MKKKGKSEYEDATCQRRECSNEVTVEIMDKRAHYLAVFKFLYIKLVCQKDKFLFFELVVCFPKFSNS